ncbi:MAG: PBP1A family penicillin-binding protein [Patescibacteria group bacterium]|nr:PBP1A family penicillin-binding protein [Patescibacteria group bacterium]
MVKKISKKELFIKLLKFGGILLALGVLIMAMLFLYYIKDLPDPGKINKRIINESTKIYDRTGEHILYEIHGEEKRTVVPFDQIPDTVKYAAVVLEDQGFYSHHGIDFKGILRSLLKDVMKGSLEQGGSTITQQFVKNSILTSEKRISRKIKEVILAIEIEQKFSKDEILQMYLNEIPYGSNAYGIEAAAQTFFGVHANELSLSQSAFLASLPKAPTYYSPFGTHIDRLDARWKYALDRMADLGYITREQADEAKKEDVVSQISPTRENIKAPHFVLYVKEMLVEEFGEEAMERDGLKVYTTLDWDLQQIAERVVREGVEENGEKYNFSNAALVALSPKNGQVLSMVGSRDYFDEEIDGNVNVAVRLRQPGSSFKPYVYATAFSKGYTPDTILFDVDTNFSTNSGEPYNPKNYDNKNHGPLKMKEALGMSLNVPAVKTLYLAGVNESINMAKSMGITSLNQPERYGLSLVLGGGEVKLIDHVSAFGVFANDGVKVDKTSILRVEDSKGEVIKNYISDQGEEVMDENVAREITGILSNNKLRESVFGTNNALVIPDRQVAAKTGTTNEWRDGWLIGATPSLAAGVWVGNNDNSPMAQGADGSYVAGPVWNKFMTEALKNTQKEKFQEPEEKEKIGKPVLDGDLEIEKEVEVCEYDKDEFCLANSECPDKLKDEKTFFNAHSILYYVDIDDPLKEDYPEAPEKDPQFENWEEAVEDWAKDEEDRKERRNVPTEECEASDFEDYNASIKIEGPNNGSTIDRRNITIKTNISGDAGVDKVEFFFDGKNIGTRKDNPYNISYEIPEDKNSQTVKIEARVYDDFDGSNSDSISVKIDF